MEEAGMNEKLNPILLLGVGLILIFFVEGIGAFFFSLAAWAVSIGIIVLIYCLLFVR